MKQLVIYHKNCLDGFGAAYAAFAAMENATFVPLDYSERDVWFEKYANTLEVEGTELYILDFSFNREQTEKLLSWSDRFIWLDHHKTAFESWCEAERTFYKDVGQTTCIILDNNKSGALLAWEYFHPDQQIPEVIRHIDDRDRWQWKMEGTKEVCLALSQLPQDFMEWNAVLYDANTLYIKGKVIQEYFDTQLQRAVLATKEECTLLDFKGLCCNLPPMFASEAGNMLAKESGTFGATYYKDSKGNVNWSLRSVGDFDVSAIAKQFGGGGHKNAAGFVLYPESGMTEKGVTVWLTKS